MIYNDKKWITSVLLITLILVTLLGVFYRHQITDNFYLLMLNFSSTPFRDIVITENIQVFSEWKQIEVKDPLNIKGDGQFLSVVIDDPFEGDFFKDGIRTPEGEVFNLEVKLLDKDGKEYLLPFDGFLGNMRVNYRYEGKLPADKVFNKVLIRSDVPIKAKKIIWSYYYTKDLR